MASLLKRAKSAELLDRTVYKAGKVIFHEGKHGNLAFIIEAGLVEIVKNVGQGEVVLGRLGKGAIFGEMALIDDAPRMATARAVECTVVIEIDRVKFDTKMAEADPFIAGLLRILAGHTRSAATAAACAACTDYISRQFSAPRTAAAIPECRLYSTRVQNAGHPAFRKQMLNGGEGSESLIELRRMVSISPTPTFRPKQNRDFGVNRS